MSPHCRSSLAGSNCRGAGPAEPCSSSPEPPKEGDQRGHLQVRFKPLEPLEISSGEPTGRQRSLPPAPTPAPGQPGLWAQPWANTLVRGKQPPSSVLRTGLGHFSRGWTAGGGIDKTPCLWRRRGRERGKKRGRNTRERGGRGEGKGKGRKGRLERGQEAGVGFGRCCGW